MENINKENFFNEVEKKFPVAYKMFDEWVTNGKTPTLLRYLWFDELPFLFQVGVIVKFIDDHNTGEDYSSYYTEWYTSELLNIDGMINAFSGFLQYLDELNNPDHRLTNPIIESDDDLPF